MLVQAAGWVVHLQHSLDLADRVGFGEQGGGSVSSVGHLGKLLLTVSDCNHTAGVCSLL